MHKILHIGKFYPPHHGGMEQVVYDLVRRQSARFVVSVLCCADGLRTSIEQRDGAEIARIARLGTIASMPLCPELIWRVRDFEPDLVHLHTPNPLGAVTLLAGSFKCPVIVEHHSDTLGRPLLRSLAGPFVRAAMDRADIVIATSKRYLETSAELRKYAPKTTIVPCGINLPATGPETLNNAAALREQWGKRLIVAVGRLVPYKGFDVLIDAMRAVDGTLLLIGNGPLRQSLLSQAEQANLTHRVHLLHRVPEVEPYLRAADVFAMPSVSRAEAFGLVQVEAMACGTPVVNTDIDSAVPEISVHGITGLTVPPGNSSDLASALTLLLDDEKLRLKYGQAARKRAAEHFTADLMAQRIEALYTRLGVAPEVKKPSTDRIEKTKSTYTEEAIKERVSA